MHYQVFVSTDARNTLRALPVAFRRARPAWAYAKLLIGTKYGDDDWVVEAEVRRVESAPKAILKDPRTVAWPTYPTDCPIEQVGRTRWRAPIGYVPEGMPPRRWLPPKPTWR